LIWFTARLLKLC